MGHPSGSGGGNPWCHHHHHYRSPYHQDVSFMMLKLVEEKSLLSRILKKEKGGNIRTRYKEEPNEK